MFTMLCALWNRGAVDECGALGNGDMGAVGNGAQAGVNAIPFHCSDRLCGGAGDLGRGAASGRSARVGLLSCVE